MRNVGLCVTCVFLLLYAMPALAGDDDMGVLLFPRPAAGQRVAVAWRDKIVIREAVAEGVSAPYKGLIQKSIAAQLEWSGNKDESRALDIQFGECDQVVTPAKEVVQEGPLPFALMKVQVDGPSDKPRITVAGRKVEDAGVIDIARHAFTTSLMRATPVKVGDKWASNQVQGIFGGEARGVVDLKLAKIERGEDGRSLAVVELSGRVTRGGKEPDAGVYEFTGTMRIDPRDGLIESAMLNGKAELAVAQILIVHADNRGDLIMRGPWSYTRSEKRIEGDKVDMEPAKPPVEVKDPGEPKRSADPPNPLDPD